MPNAKNGFAALLYRFRGYILGLVAIVLVITPPCVFSTEIRSGIFYMDRCVWGVLIAISLYVVSAFLRVQSRRFIGAHTRGHVHAADALVTCGPYACVRHPLYISNTGFALGVAFFHLGVSLWIVPFMIVVVAFEMALSRIEDRFLEQKFGDVWRDWAVKTPAFFPRLGHLNDSSCDSKHVPAQRTFWQAFFSDSSTWLWLFFCNLLLVLRKVAVFYV